jgi:NTE family protein
VRLPWDYPRYGVTDIDAVRIVDAVHASAAIPFFFTPVRFTAHGAQVDGVDYPRSPIAWVDGGLLSNFPVEVFDRTDDQPRRWRTLGIKLSAQQTVVPSGRPIRTIVDEGIAVFRTLLNNSDRYYVSSEKARRTVFVDTQGVGPVDFGLGAAEQDRLFTSGQQAARDWLAHHAVAPITP